MICNKIKILIILLLKVTRTSNDQSQVVEDLIRNTRDQNISKLDLHSRNLETLPNTIFSLENLKHLHIYNNQLTSLPEEIGKLTNLKELYIYNNQLTSLPEEIGKLTSLENLDLSGNQLTSLPKEIGNLRSLKELNIHNNQLTSLSEIGNLTSLEYLYPSDNQLTSLPKEIGNLTNLKHLYLYNNQLTSLPKEIGNLRSLKVLYLYNNQLTSLPKEIGKLTGLEYLYLYNNQFNSLPEEIRNLTSLEYLYLHNNQFNSLPEEIRNLTSLEYLYLYNNQLTSLPKEIGKLKSLKGLHISDNQLISLPKEIESIFENYGIELHISGNPIKYYDGNNLCAIDLHEKLGNEMKIRNQNVEDFLKERFFEQLKYEQKPWNMNEFKQIKLENIQSSNDLTKEQMIQIWENIFCLSEDVCNKTKDYINNLYNEDISDNNTPQKNVFKAICKKLDILSDDNKKSCKDLISETMMSIQDQKDTECQKLCTLYCYICYIDQEEEKRFENLVRNEIAAVKDVFIEEVVQKCQSAQGWENKSEEEIRSEIESNIESLDISNVPEPHIAKAIILFYTKLSLGNVVNQLVRIINQSSFLLMQSKKFIKSKSVKSTELKELFEFKNNDDLSDTGIERIKNYGIRRILIKIHLLSECQQEQ